MKTTLTLRYTFDVAHRILFFSKRDSNLHGHRLVMKVLLATTKDLGKEQVVINCHDVDEVIHSIIKEHDHKTLLWVEDELATNETVKDHCISVPYNPTAEGMAHYFYDLLSQEFPQYVERVFVSVDENLEASFGI